MHETTHAIDPQRCSAKAEQLAVDLGLCQNRRLSIATIGGGMPYLTAAAQTLGHRALAVHAPDSQVEQIAAALGVETLALEITRDRLPLNRRFDLIVCLGFGATNSETSLRDAGRIVAELVWWLDYRGRIVLALDPSWAGGRWRLVSRWRRHVRPRAQIRLVDGRIEVSRRGLI